MTALFAHILLFLSGFLAFHAYLAGAQGRLVTMIAAAAFAGILALFGWVLA